MAHASQSPRRAGREPAGRRPAVATPIALAAAALAAACGGTPPSPPPSPTASATAGPALQVRLSLQTFVTDSARVASLVKAVRVMKSRDTSPAGSAEYRTSWQYWSALHGYYGVQALAGRVEDAVASTPPQLRHFFDGITDLVPPAQPPDVAQRVWDKCQHGTPHFLTWHRMYLYFFERVLRAAAGDDGLRLPYWDYTDPGQLVLPAVFAQEQFQGGPNPLFDPRRRSQSVTLSATRTNIDGLLRQADFSTFEGNLEQQPHGYVHCAVGAGCPIPLMGDVPVAATDPVFWTHHANIDRIWECWLRQGRQVPDGAFRQQAFDFVNETGSLVTLSVGELLGSTSPIDYTYENVTRCRRTPETRRAAPAPGPSPEAAPAPSTVDSAAGVAIDKPLTKVSLKVPRTGTRAESFKRAFGAERPAEAGVELVLDGIQVDTAPGVMFDVYLSRKDGRGERQYVGTLTFFGAARHAAHARGPLRRQFDVSEQVRSLVGELDTDALDVVFEATTGVEGARVEEARRAFDPRAGLKVGKVELRVKGAAQP